ncbi:MAG TPA: AAA domain-containing protein [Candidatus Acidoferrales bacterium]|nr:AAA domain-containing protein [Candidatus Acidoferrales bacterium]
MLKKRISLYVTALQNEIEALRNYSSRNYSLSAGKFLGNADTEFLYEFKFDDDARMGEDVPVEIDVEGNVTRGSLVAVESNRIVLLLQGYIGDKVDHAMLRTAPYFLLEQLIDRLESIEDKDVECIEALFGEDEGEELGQDIALDPKKLNEFQVKAARSVIKRQISFIWGPPGTGKTQTLAFTAANLVSIGEKVLIISNTNIAVDVALQKTLEYLKDEDDYFNGKFVRFGIPRFVELEDFPWSLPQYVARDKNPALYATIEKVEKDIRGSMTQFRNPGSKRRGGHKRLSDLREKLSKLREEAYGKESRIVQHADLVACTAAKAAISSQIFSRRFDAVLIDEASMLYLPYVLYAASLAIKRVAIFGDFMQIPPITQSSTRVLNILSRDIFRETSLHRYATKGHKRLNVLEVQYRMPLPVMELINDRIYAGKLKASDKIRGATPKEEPVVFYDTSPLNSKPFREATTNSRVNILSGIAATDLAVESLKHGAKSVGIITPYRAQARFLRSVLNSMGLDRISAATVHTFQGNECDVVVFDFVDDRPLPLGVLLASREQSSTFESGDDEDVTEGERLLNVAITRARKRLLFVGNFDYLSSKTSEGSLLRFVLDKSRREKVVTPIQIEEKNEKKHIGSNFAGISMHHGFTDAVIPLLRDIQGSAEELKLVQPIKSKLQFFKYVLNKEVESAKEFQSLEMSVLQQKLRNTNLITSDKSDLFFWIIDGKILHVFDILGRDEIFSLRIGVPEITKVFNYILPRKSSKLTGVGGKEVDVHCSVCGGKMELKEMKGMIVAQCADNQCITAPADGKIIEAILEESGESCPIDAGKIKVKRGRRGFFAGCANYPACNWTADLGEILK